MSIEDYRKVVVSYFGCVEVQGISHRSDWCVREYEEPAFEDGYALNDVKLND